jgi:hypothetical protein
MRVVVCCAVILFTIQVVAAQVSNNNIAARSALILDGNSIQTTTANSTVEWSCISKALTNKCLVYHNDQWFSFSPPRNGTYFLNISGQRCRKELGIQLILIEGNPCEVQSYKIIKCISKLPQDDVSVILDSLHSGITYLVNIDGFLGDYCEFAIDFNSEPKGFPFEMKSLDTLALKGVQKGTTVLLEWILKQPLTDVVSYFELYRIDPNKKQHTLQSVLTAKTNALGVQLEQYSYTDTLLRTGNYGYKVVGVTHRPVQRFLLDELTINFVAEASKQKIIANVQLNFSYNGRVEIVVRETNTNEILDYKGYDYNGPERIAVDLQKFADAGIRNFIITARHFKSKEILTVPCYINEFYQLVFGARY